MRYKFNEIAINSVEKRIPTEDDKANYIGLEHLESGSLSVSTWGSAVSLKGEKLVMRKGDVLFGKRNTYLRRASIAPHDGLFSAHGMVLRPKPGVIDPSFFPFFVNSDEFFNSTIRISVGSLSPTVNWKDMKELEFDLPPIEKQRELAELLWAANDLKESYKKLIVASDEMLKAKFREMFGECGVQSAECGVRLGDEVVITTGKKDVNFGNENGAYPFFTCSREVAHCDSYSFDCEAILLAGNGDIGNIARYSGKFEAYQRTYVIKTRESGRINIDFLFHLLRLKWVDDTRRSMLGSTIPYIKLGMLADYKFPLPPLALQQEFVEIARKADETKAALKKSISDLDNVIKGLING